MMAEGELGYHKKAEAQTWLQSEGYIEGEPVTVYYDPENPARAVLLQGESEAPIYYFLAGIFLFPAVIVGLIGLLSKSIPANTPDLETWMARRRRRES